MVVIRWLLAYPSTTLKMARYPATGWLKSAKLFSFVIFWFYRVNGRITACDDELTRVVTVKTIPSTSEKTVKLCFLLVTINIEEFKDSVTAEFLLNVLDVTANRKRRLYCIPILWKWVNIESFGQRGICILLRNNITIFSYLIFDLIEYLTIFSYLSNLHRSSEQDITINLNDK